MNKFRVPKLKDILKKVNLKKKAVQDVETRWLSTYDMLENILELNEACDILSNSYADLKLSVNDWEAIKHVVSLSK